MEPTKGVRVLDHGYVELVEAWGSDEQIIASARMSTSGAFRGWSRLCDRCKGGSCRICDGTGEIEGDERLLRYLYEHQHFTPFEMAGFTFEVQAPIFVLRQWMRHRTFSYNEMSARYTRIPPRNYRPSEKRVRAKGGSNTQAGSEKDVPLTDAAVDVFLRRLGELYAAGEELYSDALALGVPRELARLALTVGRYSRMRVSGNLRNWLAFLRLRLDESAQFEIRAYAEKIAKCIAEKNPRTWVLFEEENVS